jgi:iron complex transport system substrate-binding protein
MKIQRNQITLVLLAAALVMTALAGCTGATGTDIQKTTTPAAQAVPSGPVSGTSPAAAPALPGAAAACTPVTITQTEGREATLPCRPERIIATNSDAAELLIALGAADSVVGIVETTKNVSYIMDKIPEAGSIGDWQTPNIEKMLALEPDAVISYATSKPKNLDQIQAANITVLYLDCYRLPKLAQDARAVGMLTGHEEEAEEYARLVENTTAGIMNRAGQVPAADRPAVYFEGYSDYTAAGTGSGSDELLVMAGGKNAVATFSTSSSPKVSAEWVVSTDPDYVMKVISAKETRPFSEIADVLKKRTGWDTMKAVQQNRIYLFASGIEYGPKAYIGLAETAKVLHPDLFADLDPEGMLDRYAGVYVPGTNGTTMMYP